MSNPFDELNNKLKDQETKLTKREYMATHVMTGVASSLAEIGLASTTPSILAALAVNITDRLIAELNKPRSN
jgi:hypothetical protein